MVFVFAVSASGVSTSVASFSGNATRLRMNLLISDRCVELSCRAAAPALHAGVKSYFLLDLDECGQCSFGRGLGQTKKKHLNLGK